MKDLLDMLRTMPKPEYRCATCGECFDPKDLHWHPFVVRRIMEGWHCRICEPNTPAELRVTLSQMHQLK